MTLLRVQKEMNLWRLTRSLVFSLCFTLLLLPGVNGVAQTFDSTSDGSDGALDLTGMEGDVLFDPTTFEPQLDPDGDNVYHFTSIVVPATVTVQMKAPLLNFAPVFWLASGEVNIDGTINLNGQNGHIGALGATRTISIPGPGGFPGGLGSSLDSPRTAGLGPGGSTNGGGYGTSVINGGRAYGNLFLLPLIGGSGGGGGGREAGSFGGGGGAGGGALLIASSVSITVNGAITSRGGDNASGDYWGAGGSGGAVRLIAPVISGSGSVNAGGGIGHVSNAHGGKGRIRLEAYRYGSLPSLNGVWRAVTLAPNTVFLPTQDPAKVRVTSVDGITVPVSPIGSFQVPDVSLNKSEPVIMEIEAENIPLGTAVTLHVFADSGADRTITSSPLVGKVEASSATASVTLPSGFSRCFVRATWTP